MTLTLYSKPGCHLCDDVRQVLEDLQADYRFAIEEIDITTDAALFARYRYDIPVVLRDGKEIGRGPVTGADLVRVLVT